MRLGSDFALEIRPRSAGGTAGVGADRQRYEVQLTPDGSVHVGRPHGEPRYPVRASVVRHDRSLDVAMQTLLRSGEGFEWRAEIKYLPRFPLGDAYLDGLPEGSAWVRFGVGS